MSELDRYLDEFGTRLRNARRPRRRARGLAAGAALGLAAAVMVAVLLIGPGGGGRPVDAAAAVRQVLNPRGVVLHFRIRVDLPGGGLTTSYEETWSAQDPQRWRLKSSSLQGSKLTYAGESAYAHGEHRDYSGHTLVITSGYRDYTPQTRLPSLFSQSGNDPDADLRALLTSGRLTDEGEVQARGRTVRRLVRDDGLRKMVFDVDPQTFTPLGGSITFRRPQNTKIPEFTDTFTVEAFERLPLNPETEKLLTFTPPAGTRVVTRTAAQIRRYQREYRAWRKRCEFGARHRLKCPKNEPKLPGA